MHIKLINLPELLSNFMIIFQRFALCYEYKMMVIVIKENDNRLFSGEYIKINKKCAI